jgi:hypothetical protein
LAVEAGFGNVDFRVGCQPARDTTEAIMQAGFDIEEIERFGFSAQRFEPLIPHILGIARRI